MNIPFPMLSLPGTQGPEMAATQKGQDKGLFALARTSETAKAKGNDAFIDFILARVASLQMTEADIAELKTKQENGKAFFSKEEGILASLLESQMLNPEDAVTINKNDTISILNGSLAAFSKETLSALKQLSAAVIKAHEEGTIELPQDLLAAFQSLAQLNIDSMKEVMPADLLEDTEDTANTKKVKETIEDEALSKTANLQISAQLVSALEKAGLIEKVENAVLYKNVTVTLQDDGSLSLSSKEFHILMTGIKENIRENSAHKTDDKPLIAALNIFISDLKKISKDIDSNKNISEEDIAAFLNALAPGGTEATEDKTEKSAETSPAAAILETQNKHNKNSNTTVDDIIAVAQNTLLPSEQSITLSISGQLSQTMPQEAYEWRTSLQDEDYKGLAASQSNKASALSQALGQQVRMATPAGAHPFFGSSQGMSDTLSGDSSNFDGEMNFALLKGAENARMQSHIQAAVNLRHSAPQSPVTHQVSVHIQKALANGDSRINVKLQPAELGRVDVRMEISKDGHLKATLIAEKPETLLMLQRDASQLQRALNEAGLQTSSQDLSFQLQQGHKEAGQQDGKGSNDLGQNTTENDALTQDDALSHPEGETIITPYKVDYRV